MNLQLKISLDDAIGAVNVGVVRVSVTVHVSLAAPFQKIQCPIWWIVSASCDDPSIPHRGVVLCQRMFSSVWSSTSSFIDLLTFFFSLIPFFFA
jgi:hypothetical protein